MGKVLIIRGADFSQNNVDIVPEYVNNIFTPKKTNAIGSYPGYLNRSTHNWLLSAGNEYLFYPIRKGNLVSIPGINPTLTSATLLKSFVTQGTDIPADFMTNAYQFRKFAGANVPMSFLAREDGYLGIYNIGDGEDIFPNNVSVEKNKYPGSRTLTKDNFNLSADNVYLASNGTYGETTQPEGKHAALYYNVYAGEKVTITAKSNSNAFVCFMSFETYGSEISTSGGLPYVFSGQTRQTIQAGQTVELLVPADCLLYIYAYDATTDLFPESLTISGITL